MSNADRKECWWSFWLVNALVVAIIAFMLVAALQGCAAGSTSEITPAESRAQEKSLRFTPESSKRSSTRVKITLPAESEAK